MPGAEPVGFPAALGVEQFAAVPAGVGIDVEAEAEAEIEVEVEVEVVSASRCFRDIAVHSVSD